jgi:hypothetical protein
MSTKYTKEEYRIAKDFVNEASKRLGTKGSQIRNHMEKSFYNGRLTLTLYLASIDYIKELERA